ncbi:MAG: phosphopantetheine-binding protein [Gammaproteobacteria bacterium]
MVDQSKFLELLKKHARAEQISMDDTIFGDGLNISSVRFTEFIMDLEEEFDMDIDIDDLDTSITKVGQLYERIC